MLSITSTSFVYTDEYTEHTKRKAKQKKTVFLFVILLLRMLNVHAFIHAFIDIESFMQILIVHNSHEYMIFVFLLFFFYLEQFYVRFLYCLPRNSQIHAQKHGMYGNSSRSLVFFLWLFKLFFLLFSFDLLIYTSFSDVNVLVFFCLFAHELETFKIGQNNIQIN